MSKKKTISLNIYLIKKECDSIERIFKDVSKLEQLKPKQGATIDAIFYYQPPHPSNSPKWLSTISDIFDVQDLDLKVLNNSGVVILKECTRYFAICFSHGRHFLNEDMIERNFGLKVALNSLEKDQLEIIEILTPEILSLRTRKQLARASSIGEFNVNIIMDVLKRVTGKLSKDDLAKHITGADSLRLSVERGFKEVNHICREALKRLELDVYKKNGFEFIDFLIPIKDRSLIASLELELIEQINAGSPNILMAPPEIEEAHIEGYQYKGKRDRTIYPYLSISDYTKSFGVLVSSEDLHRHRIEVCFADDIPNKEWKVHHCLFFDVTVNKKHYILSDDCWYCIDQGYFDRINKVYRSYFDSTLKFPNAKNKEDEQYYNIRAAGIMSGLLLDRILFKVDESRKEHEFCDIFLPVNKSIVHVKPFHASSNLSHLFNQAKFSAQFFGSDGAFTNNVLNKLEIDTQHVNRQDYSVVLAIIREKYKNGTFDIPFFSKVILIDTAEKIKSFGYKKITFVFIEREVTVENEQN